MEVLESPEMRELLAVQQRAALDGRYAGLFKALRLSPDQLEQLKRLLVDKQNAMMDVMSAARRQGFRPGSHSDIATLVRNEQETIDGAIRDMLGTTAYEEYQEYERTAAQRAVVDQLANRLSYSDAPLTPDQAEALVDLLYAARTQSSAGPADPAAAPGVRFAVAASSGGADVVNFAFPGGGEGPSITDAALAGAETVLSEAQLAALRQLQAEQLTQQKISELLRQSLPMPPPGAGPNAAVGTWVTPPGAETAPLPRP
jgi:hypothetical protein